MTAQIAENLIYQGNTVAMCTQPLDSYFGLSGLRWQFQSDCTALWRGYVGTCRIPDDWIDNKRYPLFMARSVLQALLEQLQH